MTNEPAPRLIQCVRDLFDALIDLDSLQREQRLTALDLPETIEHQLRRLLNADPRDAPIPCTPVAQAVEQLRDDRDLADRLIGTRVGSFELLELIGQGGSAVVFRAQRAVGDAVQTVALKLMRTGLYSADAQRRFAREQTILAQLTHPHIAHLIEGGISDSGVPFIAMEFVDGLPVTRHADIHALGLRERLRLIITLCRAVEAAHAALVVHRDLKPSNVYVDIQGELKVLDFGIAKLLEDEDTEATRTQAIQLTPEYAAPEQFQPGPITIAADVYALGVMLRELLTGQLLGRGDTRNASTVAADRHDRPVPRGLPDPALLARRLRGDLDAIIATALAEEPGRRYHSAGLLADDIGRYLDGRPVRAHPPSRWYRAHKFVGRHRGGVLVTAVLVLAVLASLSIAIRQAQIARQEATRAGIVRDFLVRLFEVNDAGVARDTLPSTQTLLRDAGARIDSELRESDPLRAELQLLIGNVSRNLGLLADAGPLLTQAAATADRLYARDDPRWLEAQSAYGEYLLAHADYAEAIDALGTAIAHAPSDEAGSEQLSRMLRALAHAKSATGNKTGAQADLARSRALVTARYGANSPQYYRMLVEESELAVRSADFKNAIETKRALLEQAQRLFGAQHVETFAARYALAFVLWKSGDVAEAERLSAACERDFGIYYPKPNEMLVNVLSLLGSIQIVTGNLDEAQATFRRLYRLQTNELVGSRTLGTTLHNLAGIAFQRDRNAEALDLAMQAATSRRNLFGEETVEYAGTLRLIGQIQKDLGHYDAAFAALNRSSAAMRKASGADNPTISNNESSLADLELKRGNYDDATLHARQAVAGLEQAYSANHRFPVEAKIVAAKIDIAKRDFATALRSLRQLESVVRNGDATLTRLLPNALQAIGEAEAGVGHHAAARAALQEALALREARGAQPDDAAVVELRRLLREPGHD